MGTAILKPFIRYDLDILFVGLNPAIVSNHKGHYFSVKQSFWTQLYEAGLITSRVDKDAADEIIFGDTKFNLNNFDYGITGGVGVELRLNRNVFVLEGRYSFGLGDIFGNKKADVFHGSSANRGILVTLSYMFNVWK